LDKSLVWTKKTILFDKQITELHMADLSAKYLGIELKSPIIIGNTNNITSIEQIKELEANHAGAIILNAIFQEQIEVPQKSGGESIMEDYSLKALNYLKFITEAKKETSIPLIASINCFSTGKWSTFIKKIEEAGADAIELNVFNTPNDKDFRADDYEKVFLETVSRITYEISIPVSVRLSPYFTNLINIVDQLFFRGIQGVSLFNDVFQPDIDLDELELTQKCCSSLYDNFGQTLKWSALIATSLPKTEICAGIYSLDHEKALKLLLSGVHAVQVDCVLKQKEIKKLKSFIEKISAWMDEKGFEKIEHIQGQVNYNLIKDLFQFERTSFLNQFSS
jgi:dihydroorotate dehydrogenase (fumarate)